MSIVEHAGAIKIALVAVVGLALAAGHWIWAGIGQATASPTSIENLIPAGALTGTAGALVWVVRQIVSGNLVHHEPLESFERMTEALERSNDIAARALEREAVLTKLMMDHYHNGDPT